MSDDTSPWPERERTQRLLFAAGALLLVPVVVGLADLADIGGAVVVLCATLASALLVYGLLGWAGTWVEADRPGDGTTSGTDGTAEDDEASVAGGEDGAADGESGTEEVEGDMVDDAGTGGDTDDDENGTEGDDADSDTDSEPESPSGDRAGSDT